MIKNKKYINKPDQIEGVPIGDAFTMLMNDCGMIDSCILPEDKLTVRRQAEAGVGDIIVAIHDDQFLVRRIGIVNGNFYLVPDNDGYIPVKKSDTVTVGRVIGMERDLR